ncbi:hypothetical protein ACA874_002804 [Vibrio vulnificus]
MEKMMLRFILKMLIPALVVIVLGVYFRDIIASFKYELFKDVMATLMSLSSIIFAIIGAWVAIIYPRAITRVFVGNQVNKSVVKEAEADNKYLSTLVLVILVSAIILISILLIQLLVPIYLSIPALFKYAAGIKVAGVIVIAILGMLQLVVFFNVLSLNYRLLADGRKATAKGRTDKNHQ